MPVTDADGNPVLGDSALRRKAKRDRSERGRALRTLASGRSTWGVHKDGDCQPLECWYCRMERKMRSEIEVIS